MWRRILAGMTFSSCGVRAFRSVALLSAARPPRSADRLDAADRVAIAGDPV